jgi:uncharacterized Zn-finger protein
MPPCANLLVHKIFENRSRGLADKPLSCGLCSAVFKSHDQYKLLIEHILKKHTGPQLMDHTFIDNYSDAAPAQFACEECIKTFSRSSDLHRHMGAMHYQELFSCEKCSKIFKQKDNYRNHLKNHYDSENTCLTCGKNFMTSSALSRHLEMGEVCGLQCEKCTKTFSRRSTMLNHQKKCTTNEPSKWHCELCATTFEAKVHLERHRKEGNNADGSAKFRCIDCRKKFCSFDLQLAHNRPKKECDPSKCDAVEWLRRFREESVFQCEKCGTIFSSKDEFKKHFWAHIDIKKEEFHCKLCDMKFRWSKALKRHKDASFDGEGKHKHWCDVCEMHFCTGKQKTTHHIATHRDFPCSDCGQVFSKKRSLDVHVRNQIRLTCKDCNKLLCNKRLLKMHLIDDHKNFLEAVRIK